jgi:hypothetical protein
MLKVDLARETIYRAIQQNPSDIHIYRTTQSKNAIGERVNIPLTFIGAFVGRIYRHQEPRFSSAESGNTIVKKYGLIHTGEVDIRKNDTIEANGQRYTVLEIMPTYFQGERIQVTATLEAVE